MNKLISTVIVSVALAAGSGPAIAEEMTGSPFNRIVVLVDASQSFKARRLDAMERTQQIVHQLSTRRTKRWDTPDQIVIISLDALPEVLWEGDARTLAAAGRNDWVARFKGRSDYAGCTDVEAALELAMATLERPPRAAGKYLIGFSDLIHEPPTRSLSTCMPPKLPSVPAKNFSWERLADVSVSMFWLPSNQKLAWDRAMKEAGLSTFRLYTNSESAAVDIELPKPALRKVSAQELASVRETAQSWGWSVLKWALTGVVVLALGIAACGLVAVLRRRGLAGRIAGGGGGDGARAGRRIAGPVPPMILPPRR